MLGVETSFNKWTYSSVVEPTSHKGLVLGSNPSASTNMVVFNLKLSITHANEVIAWLDEHVEVWDFVPTLDIPLLSSSQLLAIITRMPCNGHKLSFTIKIPDRNQAMLTKLTWGEFFVS